MTRENLALDDHVIEVDLTPNRADCLSVRGIARDVAASCGAEYTGREPEPVEAVHDARFPIRLDKLNGEIVVRRGRAGEKLVLLDETEAELDEDILAICDSTGPVAIAGIMGGLDSGVSDSTQDILFEREISTSSDTPLDYATSRDPTRRSRARSCLTP